MLKVTHVAEDDRTVTLRLEGRIVGQWVNELKRECEICLGKRRKLILDLSGVSFIDNQGITTLKTLLSDRVQLIGCSLFITGILKGVRG